MIVLFTAIFTMMTVIEDRKEGFLLSVLVAPVSRSVIVLGKVLGGATLATLQGVIFLVFAPVAGHSLYARQLRADRARDLPGRVLADRARLHHRLANGFDRGFHAIINLFLIPLWLLSGSLFPLAGASIWIRAADAHQPADLRDRRVAHAAVSRRTGRRSCRSATNLRRARRLHARHVRLLFLVANRRSTKPGV